MANNINGKAMANENPNIPIIGAKPPFDADSTNKVPTIGPVQEKETTAKAKAIKKIPTIPPLSAFESIFVAHELGKTISKAPKNESAKITNKAKKIKLNVTLVDNSFKASAPKIPVINDPNKT